MNCPDLHRFKGLALPVLAPLVLALGACASAPPAPTATVAAEIVSIPDGLDLLFRGKHIGSTPVELTLARLEESLEIQPKELEPPVVERRVKILGPDRVRITILRGDAGESQMGKVLGLSSVTIFDYGDRTTFDVNSAELNESSVALLATQAQLVRDHFPGIDLYICGHTDSTGGADLNSVLSLERAQAVADRLVELGVDRQRLKVQGFAADYPVADNRSTQGRTLNRRTEIVLPQ